MKQKTKERAREKETELSLSPYEAIGGVCLSRYVHVQRQDTEGGTTTEEKKKEGIRQGHSRKKSR